MQNFLLKLMSSRFEYMSEPEPAIAIYCCTGEILYRENGSGKSCLTVGPLKDERTTIDLSCHGTSEFPLPGYNIWHTDFNGIIDSVKTEKRLYINRERQD
jgi:hypothetical protein